MHKSWSDGEPRSQSLVYSERIFLWMSQDQHDKYHNIVVVVVVVLRSTELLEENVYPLK